MRLLSPYAPHLAEELWRRLGHELTLLDESWPTWDEQCIAQETIAIAIQVMGKLRATQQLPADWSKEQILKAAKEHENIARWLEGKEIVREIFVPGRLVNFVVR